MCIVFTARCTVVQSVVLRSHVVGPSVRLFVRPSVCLSVCLSVSPSKRAGTIKMQFGMLQSVGPSNDVLERGPDQPREGKFYNE